mmetsp:Transcript_23021/g.25584  ORF Transcript_23021/g.25584 Transcript_23021/m.25584 type:complete len:248 (-) Transcript_23021:40-783(-)
MLSEKTKDVTALLSVTALCTTLRRSRLCCRSWSRSRSISSCSRSRSRCSLSLSLCSSLLANLCNEMWWDTVHEVLNGLMWIIESCTQRNDYLLAWESHINHILYHTFHLRSSYKRRSGLLCSVTCSRGWCSRCGGCLCWCWACCWGLCIFIFLWLFFLLWFRCWLWSFCFWLWLWLYFWSFWLSHHQYQKRAFFYTAVLQHLVIVQNLARVDQLLPRFIVFVLRFYQFFYFQNCVLWVYFQSILILL